MSPTHESGAAGWAPRLAADGATLRLLEARRDALLERSERLAAEQRLRVSQENLRECQESLEILNGALEAEQSRSRDLEGRVEELQQLTSAIFSSRRWRLWNVLRYRRRGSRRE